MLESSVNLLLVLLSILLPVWGMTDQVIAGAQVRLPFGAWTFPNAVLSGLVLIFTFHRSRAAFERDLAKKRRTAP